MFVVAVAELAGPVDAAVPILATKLGTTAYELRLTLNAGFPAVVLATTDADRATRATGSIEACGHRAVLCDRRAVVSSSAMTSLRDFQLDGAGIAATSGGADLLPYADILALLRATHRTATETTREVKERKLAPGMAIATGGLVMTKATTRELTTRVEEREQVLYLFRRSGAPAWILRERAARYQGLGPELSRTSLENFATTIRRLRESSPDARYDERLVTARPVRGVADGVAASDLLAHLLAADLLRG